MLHLSSTTPLSQTILDINIGGGAVDDNVTSVCQSQLRVPLVLPSIFGSSIPLVDNNGGGALGHKPVSTPYSVVADSGVNAAISYSEWGRHLIDRSQKKKDALMLQVTNTLLIGVMWYFEEGGVVL